MLGAADMLAEAPALLLGPDMRSLALGPTVFENCDPSVRQRCQARLLECFEVPQQRRHATAPAMPVPLRALTSLSLTGTLPAVADRLCTALAALTALQSLRLRKLGITAAMAKRLAASAAAMSELRVLDVSDNRLHDAGVCAVCAPLPALQRLETLRLQHNDAGERGAQAVFEAVRELAAVSSVSLSGVQQASPALAALRAMPRLLELSR